MDSWLNGQEVQIPAGAPPLLGRSLHSGFFDAGFEL
jgi:hypothetical protein